MTTYYLNPDTGDDGDAGTSTGTAWATLQKAADTASAGDEVIMMASAAEQISTRVDLDTNAGTAASRIRFRGADSSGDVYDGDGKYVVQAASGITGGSLLALSKNYVTFEDIDFDANGHATYAVEQDALSAGVTEAYYRRCNFHDATSHGVNLDDGSFSVTAHANFIACKMYDNGGDGLWASSSSGAMLYGCDVYNNSDNGVSIGWVFMELIGNKIWGNTNNGIEKRGSTSGLTIMNNTVHDNGANGIDFAQYVTHTRLRLMNNIFTSNGGYGVDFNTTNPQSMNMDYNYFGSGAFANTSGDSDATLTGVANQSGDPKFTDADNGDFAPLAGSLLIGTGLSGSNIGAVAHGQGGGLIKTSMQTGGQM